MLETALFIGLAEVARCWSPVAGCRSRRLSKVSQCIEHRVGRLNGVLGRRGTHTCARARTGTRYTMHVWPALVKFIVLSRQLGQLQSVTSQRHESV